MQSKKADSDRRRIVDVRLFVGLTSISVDDNAAPILDVECAIIGGGPAGLTAALYLARFRRQVLVIDARQSRAELIPVSHNYPAVPAIQRQTRLAETPSYAFRSTVGSSEREPTTGLA